MIMTTLRWLWASVRKYAGVPARRGNLRTGLPRCQTGIFYLSCPAKAGHPIAAKPRWKGLSGTTNSADTGSPAFARDDREQRGGVMAELPRLNGVIRALESGKPAFTTFAQAENETAIALATAKYDGVIYEMEHNPWDIRALRDSMQYMLNRGQIVKSGAV